MLAIFAEFSVLRQFLTGANLEGLPVLLWVQHLGLPANSRCVSISGGQPTQPAEMDLNSKATHPIVHDDTLVGRWRCIVTLITACESVRRHKWLTSLQNSAYSIDQSPATRQA